MTVLEVFFSEVDGDYDDVNYFYFTVAIDIGARITRRGFKESDIKYLCDLMMDIMKGKRKPSEARKDVIALRQNFKEIKYGFQSVNEVIKHLKKNV